MGPSVTLPVADGAVLLGTWQQVVVIKRMVADLNMNLELVVVPTVREPDGLAMSSRNTHLTPGERKAALSLHRSLKRAEELILHGERSTRLILEEL
jgi:pantoate--beta-alanine ligase